MMMSGNYFLSVGYQFVKITKTNCRTKRLKKHLNQKSKKLHKLNDSMLIKPSTFESEKSPAKQYKTSQGCFH